MRVPSGDGCGSATQTKRNRSVSVMSRFAGCCAKDANERWTARRIAKSRHVRMRIPYHLGDRIVAGDQESFNSTRRLGTHASHCAYEPALSPSRVRDVLRVLRGG